MLVSACLLAMMLVFGTAGTVLVKAEESDALRKVTVILDYIPNTNHSGMYVALDKGYYQEEGLDVEIVEPTEGATNSLIANGVGTFGIAYQEDVTLAVASEDPLPIKAIAAIIQHNTSGIMSKKGEGMDRPAGLTGKTYLTWDSPTEKAIMENVVNADGGDWSKVKLIPNTVTEEAQDVNQNPDHAIWVFYAWGGINSQVSGIDTDFFFFKDINPVFDYYTPILIANNDFLKTNPDAAKKFLSAAKQGYEFAVSNPEEAADILIKGDDTASLAGSEQLVEASQKYLAKEYISDAPKWGYIDAARWDAFYKWLYDSKLIEKEIPAGTGFSNDYLS